MPVGGVTEGPDGALYGTTSRSGIADAGTIFRISRSVSYSTLIDFTGADGFHPGFRPAAPLTIAQDGAIYGTTEGGAVAKKTLFRLGADGSFSTLVDFLTVDGSSPTEFPSGPLVRDDGGNVYGVVSDRDTAGGGKIFKVTEAGSFSVLHDFSSGSANHPESGLTLGADGNYYGATAGNSSTGLGGSLFKITPEGMFPYLFTFPASPSPFVRYAPQGALYIDSEGVVYGTTPGGGTQDAGTIFKWSTEGGLIPIGSFPSADGAPMMPQFGVTRGQDGVLYGLSSRGGAQNRGTVFRLPVSDSPETLFSFSRDEIGPAMTGPSPSDRLFAAGDGNLYGVTTLGGPLGGGVVFRLRFGRAAETLQAHAITPRSGLLRASVGAGSEEAQFSFEYGDSPAVPSTSAPISVFASEAASEVSFELTGLLPKHRYYFRAKTVTATGTQRGEIQFFNTDGVPLTIAFDSPVEEAQITLPGVLRFAASASDEDGRVVRVEFLMDGAKVGEDTEAPFAFDYTNPPAGRHRITAVAYDDDGRSAEASPRMVDVLILPPTVMTLAATDHSLEGATLHGKVSSFAATATAYFEWGPPGGLNFRTPEQQISDDGVVALYEARLEGLARGTSYRFRAVAQNVSGIAVGEEFSFETLPNHPPVAALDQALLTPSAAKIFVPVRQNDSDADGDLLEVVSVSTPQHGEATIVEGVIVYAPASTFPGFDTFTYEVSDGFTAVTGTVNIIGFPRLRGLYTA
jgi:uncharacterized repeat protein (TIGR03803 family)